MYQQTEIFRRGLNKDTELPLSTQKPLQGRRFTCKVSSLPKKRVVIFSKASGKNSCFAIEDIKSPQVPEL